jgi:hypothetical protein
MTSALLLSNTKTWAVKPGAECKFFALTGEGHIRMSVRSHVSSPKLRSKLNVQYGLGSKETRFILVDLTKPYRDFI